MIYRQSEVDGMDKPGNAMKPEYTAGKIWCIVTQPDAICVSLKLREDAKGQDLLDEVMKNLVFFFYQGQSPITQKLYCGQGF